MRTYRIALPAAALAAALALTGCSDSKTDAKKAKPGAPAAQGSALASVDTLTVKGRAAKTGYSRDQFGKGWTDTDANGCATREDILKRDLTDLKFKGKCDVTSGTLTKDVYTGETIKFVRAPARSTSTMWWPSRTPGRRAPSSGTRRSGWPSPTIR